MSDKEPESRCSTPGLVFRRFPSDNESLPDVSCADSLKEHEIARRAFESIGDYLQCSLDDVLLDFHLLKKLDECLIKQYSEFNHVASEIAGKLTSVNDRYKSLQLALSKIDEFDVRITQLEQAAAILEQFSRNLEVQMLGDDKYEKLVK